jgi:tripartite-type tricarboxylate transporter receptor subunit TctC
MSLRAVAFVVSSMLVASPAAQAQEWPNRMVRIVNTFSAGATSDVLARIAASHMTGVFNQQFIVESKPGAAGAVAIRTITGGPADGYNFVLTSAGQIVVAPIMNPKLTYDPMGELIHVAFLAGSPTVIAVSPKFGIKSVQELVEYAKKAGHPITFASSGVGSSGQLVGQAFAFQAGIDVRHVPYKGAAQSLMDVVSGHVMFSAQTVSSSSSQIASGALIPLAHSGTERLPELPNVPTFKELGLGDATGLTWFALSAKTGTPADIVAKVNREATASVHAPEVFKKLQAQGMQTQKLTPEQLNAEIVRESKQWRPVIERAGLIADK